MLLTGWSVGPTGDFARLGMRVYVLCQRVCTRCVPKRALSPSPFVSSQIFGHFHKRGSSGGGEETGRGSETRCGASDTLYFSVKRGMRTRAERPHNSPIMRASCAVRVDNRRLRGIYVRASDEYRVTGGGGYGDGG